LTTRGMNEEDMKTVADYIDKCINLAIQVQDNSGKSLKLFCNALENNNDIIILKNEVKNFASNFDLYEDN